MLTVAVNTVDAFWQTVVFVVVILNRGITVGVTLTAVNDDCAVQPFASVTVTL